MLIDITDKIKENPRCPNCKKMLDLKHDGTYRCIGCRKIWEDNDKIQDTSLRTTKTISKTRKVRTRRGVYVSKGDKIHE